MNCVSIMADLQLLHQIFAGLPVGAEPCDVFTRNDTNDFVPVVNDNQMS